MAEWRRMEEGDLGFVAEVADQVHPAFPEVPEVFASRLRLFPQGCLIALDDMGKPLGYCIAHPGLFGEPPPLDAVWTALPAAADCLYLHDVALLPIGRGQGLGGGLLLALKPIAKPYGRLALTAVNGSATYWRRFGFRSHESSRIRDKLRSYGRDAAYMVLEGGG